MEDWQRAVIGLREILSRSSTCTIEQLVALLMRLGWSRERALQAIENAFAKGKLQLKGDRLSLAPAPDAPQPGGMRPKI